MVGSLLNRLTGVPWVADFRDLWSRNHVDVRGPVRTHLEERVESWVVRPARCILTVSEGLADQLRQVHKDKRVVVVPNGYEPGEYSKPAELLDAFTITYTGGFKLPNENLHRFLLGIRLLLDRMGRKGMDSRNLAVRFYGQGCDVISDAARSHGVSDIVRFAGTVSREESLMRQRESTVLLNIELDARVYDGILRGKLMEYLGSTRPILSLGSDREVRELLFSTGLGVQSSDPDHVAAVLEEWIGVFQAGNRLLGLKPDESVIGSYSRTATSRIVADVLGKAVADVGTR
jgi:hypothetical protein